MKTTNDSILNSIVKELVQKHRCHTVVLYGSRARGLTTATSDYDVLGVRKSGSKFRIAKRQSGFYWDVFVYPEKDLRVLKEDHWSWNGAQVLYQRGSYGTKLLQKIERLLKTPFKPHPKYELAVRKVWAQKQLDRCRRDDIQGLFRRAEYLTALVDQYFYMRQKRFMGPKEGLAWIEKHDPKSFQLIKRALKNPTQLSFLRVAASRVFRISLR